MNNIYLSFYFLFNAKFLGGKLLCAHPITMFTSCCGNTHHGSLYLSFVCVGLHFVLDLLTGVFCQLAPATILC